MKSEDKRYESRWFILNLGSIIAIMLMIYEVSRLSIFAYQITTDGDKINTKCNNESSFDRNDLGFDSEKILKLASLIIKICYYCIIRFYWKSYLGIFYIVFKN